jgi:hypothetical protein
MKSTERLINNIAHGNFEEIIDDSKRLLYNSVTRLENFIEERNKSHLEKIILEKQLQEIGKEHDAIRDFEHFKVSRKQKKERLSELQLLQKSQKVRSRDIK